ncbi:MAG: hypothetical protein NWE92_02450 [Candidatus Bathyarchaeota archaeon]|nr:hypothetical protein [Candidatus Bathyarchaeota archaeon]
MGHQHDKDWNLYEGLITALAVGGFFITLGLVIVATPDFVGQVNSFFQDFTTNSFPMGGTSHLVLPAPADPAMHLGLFTAVMNFMLGIGILQIVILAMRLVAHSRIGRISETVGNLVFWLGGAYTASVFLLAGTVTGWFQFWSSIMVLIGASLIARGAVYFVARWGKSKER